MQEATDVIAPDAFDGVIFDCDGTLADTMPLHFRAWCEALDSTGGVMSEALFYELGGVPTLEIALILNERYGCGLAAEVVAADKEARYEILLPQCRPVARVVELVREYHGSRPLAVA